MDLINKKPWLLYVLLFLLPPVGIFFLYKMKKFNKLSRAILTGVFSLIFLIQLGVAFSDPNTTNSNNSTPTVASVGDTKDQGSIEKSKNENQKNKADGSSTGATPPTDTTPNVDGNLKVHFINVGQADSILIQTSNGTSVLVDAGNNDDGSGIVNYLKSQGVKELAAVVATHPHEDHIGGMDTIIRAFSVKQLYMPNATSTTKTFEDMISAINASGAKRIQAKAGVKLDVPGLSGSFLAPVGTGYEDLNNYSAVLKITYGSTSFLLTGDAEGISENEMLRNGNLQATLLKVGHHGSSSSTTSSFLKAVSPKFAVISVGKGNSYGHPTAETLNKLASNGTQVFRTDEVETIVATSDGETIKIDKSASPIKPVAPPSSGSSSPTPTSTPSTPPPTVPTSSSGGVSIKSIDLRAEIVTLANSSSSSVDLTGWKIISETGNQTFFFPEGTTIPVGGTLQILSATGIQAGPNQLIWGKANIWNNDGDLGALYNILSQEIY